MLLCDPKWKVSRKDLAEIETPAATRCWQPLGHLEAVEAVIAEAEARGYNLYHEQYGMNPKGEQLFGVLRVRHNKNPDFTRAIGLRNSHNKSLAFGLTAGMSVLVCSNLCFGGDFTCSQKHNNSLDLGSIVPWLFNHLEEGFLNLETGMELLREKKLTDSKANDLVIQAARLNAIPSQDILKVLDLYHEPPHAEFLPRTKYSLYQAFNERAKSYSPVRANLCFRNLATKELFNLAA